MTVTEPNRRGRTAMRLPHGIRPDPTGLQPLEPRTLLSATLSAEFIAIDNSTALTGYTTAELRVTTVTDWTSAALWLELSQGSIYQDASGGIAAPDPAQFGAFPTLAFDTYLDAGNNSVLVAGSAGDIGDGSFRFDTTAVDALWFDAVGNDTGTLSIGRFTLSGDAVGAWSLRILNAAGDIFTDSGSFMSGNLATPFIRAIADEADLTGDGKADILWRNLVDGRNTVWAMDGTNFQSATAIKSMPNFDWLLVGTGDFTGDGKNDILWRNNADGRNAVWEMGGTNFLGGIDIQPLNNLTWQVIGVADFTGDGWADILWRNSQTGRNTIWEMAADTLQAATAIKRLNNFDWQAVGVSDFTGDGKADILWRNTVDGRNIVWEMDRTSFRGGIAIDALPNLKWQAVAVADFTGDSNTDILWRHNANGRNTVWEMDGDTLLSTLPVKRLANTDWRAGAQSASGVAALQALPMHRGAAIHKQSTYLPVALEDSDNSPPLGLWEPDDV